MAKKDLIEQGLIPEHRRSVPVNSHGSRSEAGRDASGALVDGGVELTRGLPYGVLTAMKAAHDLEVLNLERMGLEMGIDITAAHEAGQLQGDFTPAKVLPDGKVKEATVANDVHALVLDMSHMTPVERERLIHFIEGQRAVHYLNIEGVAIQGDFRDQTYMTRGLTGNTFTMVTLSKIVDIFKPGFKEVREHLVILKDEVVPGHLEITEALHSVSPTNPEYLESKEWIEFNKGRVDAYMKSKAWCAENAEEVADYHKTFGNVTKAIITDIDIICRVYDITQLPEYQMLIDQFPLRSWAGGRFFAKKNAVITDFPEGSHFDWIENKGKMKQQVVCKPEKRLLKMRFEFFDDRMQELGGYPYKTPPPVGTSSTTMKRWLKDLESREWKHGETIISAVDSIKDNLKSKRPRRGDSRFKGKFTAFTNFILRRGDA